MVICFGQRILPHPLCWVCKILVLSRLLRVPPALHLLPASKRNSTATSALGAGWAVVAGLVAGIFENFARSRKSAPNAHFLKEL